MQQAFLDIADVQTNKKLGIALKNISRNLSGGLTTGAAFKKEEVFPRMVAPTVDAGDRAGRLTDTFLRLSELMWLQHNLYSKVKNALFVPKIAAVMMTIMTIAYIKIAIPEYIKLYDESGIQLPWIVGFITGCVNGLVDYWPITLVVLFGCFKLWKWFSSTHISLIDGWKLKIPIYKKLHHAFLQHQMSSINSHMAHAIDRTRKDIAKGNTLASAMNRNNSSGIFDSMLLASINAGEKSNHMTLALDHDCKYYERMINNMIDPVSTKITLIVMLPMGLLIVMMFLFTLVPMFDYMGKVSGV